MRNHFYSLDDAGPGTSVVLNHTTTSCYAGKKSHLTDVMFSAYNYSVSAQIL